MVDIDGSLCIAKLPSRTDDYDAELWEHLFHLLAERAGITLCRYKSTANLRDLSHTNLPMF